jgi:hypothetical protein
MRTGTKCGRGTLVTAAGAVAVVLAALLFDSVVAIPGPDAGIAAWPRRFMKERQTNAIITTAPEFISDFLPQVSGF